MAFKKSIVLGLDSSQFDQGIDSANQKIDQFENNLEGTQNATSAAANNLDELGDSADNTAQAVVDMSQQFRNGIDILMSVRQAIRGVTEAAMQYASNIKDIASETGLSTHAVQELGYVAESTGASMENISSALKNVEKSMQAAANRSGDTWRVFKQLGVEIYDTSGKTRDASQVFTELIYKLGDVENSTERSQMALKVFGDSAKELNEMISLGRGGIAQLTQEFNDLGMELSSEDIQALSDAEKAVNSMMNSFKTAAYELAASFAPAIESVANLLKNLSPEAKQTIMVLATLTTGVIGLTMAVGALGAIYTTMMGTMGAATQTFMAQAAPIIALIAALAALALAIKEVIDTYKEWQAVTGGNFGQFLLHPDGNFEGSNIGRNAKGTSFWQGGLTWVGEEGPEIVEVPRGSRIYNNQQSTSIGGNTYNVNMNMDMTKIKKINDVVEAVEGLGISAGCRR